ncbi:MAG: PAS domain S-box protein [Desulfobaccales bacterium]
MSWKARQDALEQLRQQFVIDAATRAFIVYDALDNHLIDLQGLRSFYNASTSVTRNAFAAFVTPTLQTRPGIQAFEWIPRVAYPERARFEAEARRDGLQDYQIYQLDSKGNKVTAGPRQYYYPVDYVEPLAGNEPALGFDLGSNPARLAALEQAADTGQPVATERLTLVQETGAQAGFLVFIPVYRQEMPLTTVEQRRLALQGFVLGVFRAGDAVEAAIRPSPEKGLWTELVDLYGPAETRLLYRFERDPLDLQVVTWKTLLAPSVTLRYEHPFTFAGRQWRVEISASPAYVQRHISLSYWLIPPTGLLVTLLITLYFGALLSRKVAAYTRGLIEASLDPLVTISSAGKIMYVNHATELVTGVPREELIGRDFCDYFTEPEKAREVYRQVFSQSLVRDYPLAIRHVSGRVTEVIYNASLYTNEAGEVQGVFAAARDITERKLAGEALSKHHRELQETAQRLEQSMHMLQLIIESIPVRVFWKDYDLRYLGCNTQFARDAGLEHPQQLLGKDDFAMGWKDQADLYRADDRQVMESRRAKLNIIEPQTTPSGAQIWLNTSKVPLQHPDGEVFGVLGVYADITEYKRAEAEVKLNEARLSSLLRIFQYQAASIQELLEYALDEAIALTGSKIGYLYFYDEATRQFTLSTWSKEAMQACSIVEPQTIHQLDQTGIWGEAVRQAKPIIVNDFQAPHPLKKGYPPGHPRLDKYLTIPVVSDGKIVAVVGVANKGTDYDDGDVRHLTLMMDAVWQMVERRRIILALQESEEKYRLLINQIPAVAFQGYEDWSVDFFDNKIESLTGFRKEEFDSRQIKWCDLILPEDLDEARRIFIEALKADRSYVREYRVRKQNGSIRWIQCMGKIFCDAAGQIEHISGVFYDITARKQAEEALRESEQKYRGVIETTNTGYVVIDPEGRLLDANPEFVRLTGNRALREILGHNVTEWTAAADLERVAVAMSHCFQTGQLKSLEIDCVGRDGRATPVEINATAISTSEGVKLLSLVRDISDRKRVEAEKARLETQLVQAQKMEAIGTLAGGIAHDFNNILTAILGNIGLARLNRKIGEEEMESLVQAEQACFRAQELSGQLLTFAKGGVPIKKVTSLVKLVKESAKLALAGSQSRCDFAWPEHLWSVEIDEGQINQVISNLFINADQAMPSGGIIKITAANIVVKEGSDLPLSEGNYVKLAITDQGIGIPSKYLDKIFEPYFSTKQKGSGLGLATAYSIIKNHSGHIQVESRLGVGTTFYIYLPASLAEPVATIDEQGTPILGQGKVLVLDDDEKIRQILCRMLDRLGYESDSASEGSQAIEKFVKAQESGQPFDAVILDLTVPGGMGGKETIEKLLKIDHQVKAIVSSGYSDDPIMANFKECGFSGVLAKPYKVVDLSKILKKVISK